ncbi:hypothetical protein ACOMHN_005381 [Nucella lapillus]
MYPQSPCHQTRNVSPVPVPPNQKCIPSPRATKPEMYPQSPCHQTRNVSPVPVPPNQTCIPSPRATKPDMYHPPPPLTMKTSSLCLLLAVLTATTTSFRFNSGSSREFGKADFFNRKYQTWVGKRGLGQPSYAFGRPVGDQYRLFNWKDYISRAMVKRHLSFGPRNFGNYRSYFTDGLQDWKNTFMATRKRQALPGLHDDDLLL